MSRLPTLYSRPLISLGLALEGAGGDWSISYGTRKGDRPKNPSGARHPNACKKNRGHEPNKNLI